MSCRPVLRVVLLGVIYVAGAERGQAQAPAVPDLGRATLEELMQIQITSVGRRTQRADDAPAAVYVITSDDIQRSGIRTLPELFRLAPGVQVSMVNASHWAISIRGFNELISNKLLVLVDGRSIYKTNTAGVFWDSEDLILDDIDRIEIVRGPGGAVWGANAVNGVINIVTKTAKDTAGGLVRIGTGTPDRFQGTARYGGTVGAAAYRLYSQWTERGQTILNSGSPAHDQWSSFSNGARLDWTSGADRWTLEGQLRTGETQGLWRLLDSPRPGAPVRTDGAGYYRTGIALARWSREGSGGSALQVQSAVTISRRLDSVKEREDTIETDLQYRTKIARRHDVVAGGVYRFIDNALAEAFNLQLTPPTSRTSTASIFVQDEIELTPQLLLTAGSRVEHDTTAGWGVQPTVRALWRPAARHRVWAASSRALRTPSKVDRNLRLNFAAVPGQPVPILIGRRGNPDYETETLTDVEAGYRFEIGASLSLDATAFRGRYSGLPTYEPLTPVFEATPAPAHLFVATTPTNLMEADTSGVELAAHLAVSKQWRLDASYSAFRLTPHVDAASRDTAAASFDGNAPAHQWQLHSALWLGRRTEIDTAIYYVGRQRARGLASFTRADVRAAVSLNDRWSLAVVGRNLSSSRHAEYVELAPVVGTLVPRGAEVHLIWRVGR